MFVAITLLGIFLSSAFSIYSISNDIHSEVQDKQEENLKFKSEMILSGLESQKDKIELISKISENELSTGEDITHMYTNINAFFETNNDFKEIFLIDKTGEIIFSTDAAQTGKLSSEDEYFTNALDAVYVKPVYYSASLQEPTMTISAPIKNHNNETVYVVVGRVDLNSMNEIMIDREYLGRTGETYLVNSFNYVVTELRFEENAVFKKTMFTDGVKDCLSGSSGSKEYSDYRGNTVIGNYHWIPELKLCMLFELDKEDVNAPVKDAVNLVLITAIIMSALVIVLGVIFSGTFTKPLSKLVEFSGKLRQGKLDSSYVIDSRDELGALSKAFDEMRLGLKDRNDLLNSLLETFKGKFGNLANILVRKNIQQLSEKNPRIMKILPKSLQRVIKEKS
jgi:HAMP domain-containing protein